MLLLRFSLTQYNVCTKNEVSRGKLEISIVEPDRLYIVRIFRVNSEIRSRTHAITLTSPPLMIFSTLFSHMCSVAPRGITREFSLSLNVSESRELWSPQWSFVRLSLGEDIYCDKTPTS